MFKGMLVAQDALAERGFRENPAQELRASACAERLVFIARTGVTGLMLIFGQRYLGSMLAP
jgi:hypothetical protein